MNTRRTRALPQIKRGYKAAVGKSGISPGLYHFKKTADLSKTRIHLRVDPDGCGTLVINASSILHLNPSATMIAYYHLDGLSPVEIETNILNSFNQVEEQVEQDIKLITADLDSFIQADGRPVNTFSGVEINAPYSHHPSAPYRMDLAVTYRCNNDCSHCYNARLRSYPELNTSDWKKIIDRLWSLNIPHLIFTGGEPTLRQDLVELIQYAEDLGQITGLNTNARRLSDPAFTQSLVDAGLDHVQITVESHDPEIHDEMVNSKGAWKQTIAGVQNALNSSLFVMTNTTMLKNNQHSIGETLDFLNRSGRTNDWAQRPDLSQEGAKMLAQVSAKKN